MMIRVGSTFALKGGDLLEVDSFIAHHQFGRGTPKNAHDVAIISMKQFIELDGKTKMAKPLANFFQDFAPPWRCIIAGYGFTMDSEEDAQPERLHYLVLNVREPKMCEVAFGRHFDENTMICTGFRFVNAGACPGDSGGPFFCSGVL
jgi:Trypsin